MNRGWVRIVGGEHRGRRLQFPDRPGLRPTPDRVRETLFNWLGQDLTGRRVLDLYAGSGALGLEAASRGASSVVLVERDPVVAAALRGNADLLRLGSRTRVVQTDALEFARLDLQRYHVVFADPPYAELDPVRLVAALLPRLESGGFLYAEGPAPMTAPAGLSLTRSLRAGSVHAHLFCREP